MIERLAGSADELRVSAFPDGQRLWRIAWFGPVQFANRTFKTNQPSALVHLAEILDPSVRANPDAPISSDAVASRQVKRWVSVGTTVLLRTGDLWEGQRLFHRPALETEYFEGVQVDETTARVVKAGSSLDDGGFLIPFSEHPWHSENTHSYCIRLTLPDGRYLVIPAMELIRFYFGSSGKLMSLLFKPALNREALYERVRLLRGTGRMFLDLASGIPRASAEDIARIAGDQHAWAAAQHVGASCLRASTRRADIYPIAHFPLVGVTDLKVHGQWLSRGEEKHGTFLAYRISSCSHAFPFKSLTFKLKGQAAHRRKAPSRQAAAAANNAPVARGSRAALPEHPRLEERDAAAQLAPHTYRFRSDRAFPYLEGKVIRGVRKVEPAQARQYGPDTEAVTDLAVGGPGSSARRREALLVQAEHDQLCPGFLKPAVEACAQLEGMDVQLLTGGVEDGWTMPIMLLLDEDGVIDEALLTDEAGHSRPKRFAAFLISKGEDRLAVVFIESEPLYPLAYPSERGDEDEAQATMVCAARDFLRRVHGRGSPDLIVSKSHEHSVNEIREWIRGFFEI